MKYDIVKLMARRKIRWKKRWVSGDSGGRLTFRSKKAGTLENYRIYGNTVGGESVGDLVESGEHAGEYKVPVTVSNGTDALTTPIYLPEQIRKIGDEAEYIDYGERKQHRVRKNLMPNTATSQTINGVTFTVNEDGSVTCNGTASATASILLQAQITLNSGSYILTGCPQGGGVNTNYKLDIIDPIASVAVAVDTGSGASLTLRQNMQARIVIYTGQVLNNLTFYPMIRKADIEDDTYEPYIENTDLDVTLPALPTIKGTNVLSVGTAVQPSRVEVKGRIKAVGQETEPEPETAEPEPEAAEAEQEAAEPEQEAAEPEQETAEAEQETAEAEQE